MSLRFVRRSKFAPNAVARLRRVGICAASCIQYMYVKQARVAMHAHAARTLKQYLLLSRASETSFARVKAVSTIVVFQLKSVHVQSHHCMVSINVEQATDQNERLSQSHTHTAVRKIMLPARARSSDANKRRLSVAQPSPITRAVQITKANYRESVVSHARRPELIAR